MAYGSEIGSSEAVTGPERAVTRMRPSFAERGDQTEDLLTQEKELRSLVSELILSSEREKRHTAENIHDNMMQPLLFLNIKLDLLKKSNKEQNLLNSFDEMQRVISELIEMMRNFTFELTWPVLHQAGLEAAIEDWLGAEIEGKEGIATIFEDDGSEKDLDDEAGAFLFRAVRELVVNVVKHADAEKVKVSIAREHASVLVCVEDDGAGFDPQRHDTADKDGFHFGLFSIAQQVKCLGGSIEIESENLRGTRVIMAVPAKQQYCRQ